MEAIERSFGGERTRRSCRMTSVAMVPHRTHKKWEVDKEMEGWRVREKFTSSSSDGDGDDEDETVMNGLSFWKRQPLPTQEQFTRSHCRSHAHSTKEKDFHCEEDNCGFEEGHDREK